LPEIHTPQGWGHVQAAPAVKLWERQAQTAITDYLLVHLNYLLWKKIILIRAEGPLHGVPFKCPF